MANVVKMRNKQINKSNKYDAKKTYGHNLITAVLN